MSDQVVAGNRLIRKLERSAETAGCTVDVVSIDSRDLSCSIFVIADHRLTVAVGGLSARAWLETLDENAFCVPGHVLAQLAVGAIDETGELLLAEIEAQTVMEA